MISCAASGSTGAGEPFQLSLPLACEPHRTCFIQSYPDVEPSGEAKDYACGGATYDKHNGVDFRLLSAKATEAGVAVLAAADGRVKAARDGVPDVFFRLNKPGAVKGRECGNGVVITHADGWETKYCHMKRGSVAVSRFQYVKRGQKIGLIGFSGMADFAHVHMSVRHNGEIVDPFAPDAPKGACGLTAKDHSLWEPSVVAQFGYRNGEIIGTGFTASPPDPNSLELDHTALAAMRPNSPALLFYARFINLLAGDRVRLLVSGPGGPLVEQLSEPLERNKATYVTYTGKRRGEAPWQTGRYEARAEIVREGAVAAAAVSELDLRAEAATAATP